MSENNFEKHSFSIGDSSKLLEILRSKMYSDPIGSICREISCNARDAHREVEKHDVPIQIFLPEVNDSYLRIKDFGPGISPERMKDVYLKYTETTKDGTNQTGGFGLGAKTPFSYTNAFTIITCIDGFKYHYIAYIDETDIGALFLLDKNKTKEPNGTEIVIHVEKEDISRFTQSLIKATAFWEVKPEFFVGYDKKELSYSYYVGKNIISGDNWKISDASHGLSVGITVDGIYYPIITDKIYLGNINNITGNLVVDVDSQDITLSSTRENIYYNNKTTEFLESLFDKVEKNIYDVVLSTITNAKTFVDAILLFRKYRNHFNWVSEDIKFNDININNFLFNLRLNYYNKSYCYINNVLRSLKYNDFFQPNNVVVINNTGIKTTKYHVKKVAAHFQNNVKINILTLKDGKTSIDNLNEVFPLKLEDYCKLKKSNSKNTKRLTIFKRKGDVFSRIAKDKVLESKEKKIIVKVKKNTYTNDHLLEEYGYISCLNDIEEMFDAKIYGLKNDLDKSALENIFGINYMTLNEAIEKSKTLITEEDVIHFFFCKNKRTELIYNKYYINIDFFKNTVDYDKSLFKVLELYKTAFDAAINTFSYEKLAIHIFPELDVKEKLKTYVPENNFGDVEKISNLIDKKYPMLKFIKFPKYINDDDSFTLECKEVVSNYINNINLKKES